MIHLLDVNVLVALAWPNHVHHAAAHEWFARSGVAGWATCPLTELGFVRVSSNARAIDGALSPSAAVAQLRAMCEQPGHQFWTDAVSALRLAAVGPLVSHRQVTDAYLLLLARHHGGGLATFDRALAQLARGEECLTVLPATA